MSVAPFCVVSLNPAHDRSMFNSGSDLLDRYLRERVIQDIRRRVTSCFAAISRDGRIAGYYTLSSASVLLGDLPEKIIKKLPRYPSVPVVRMGRLAVDQAYKGQGLGGALLADAFIRAVRSDIAAYALVVDAKDDSTADFYRHHGFLETVGKRLTLFLPLATVTAINAKLGVE